MLLHLSHLRIVAWGSGGIKFVLNIKVPSCKNSSLLALVWYSGRVTDLGSILTPVLSVWSLHFFFPYDHAGFLPHLNNV